MNTNTNTPAALPEQRERDVPAKHQQHQQPHRASLGIRACGVKHGADDGQEQKEKSADDQQMNVMGGHGAFALNGGAAIVADGTGGAQLSTAGDVVAPAAPQDECARFEAWAREPIRAEKLPLEQHPNGAYKDSRSYQVWYGWQARAALLAQAVATAPSGYDVHAENTAFCQWWAEKQAHPAHTLITENAAHATWQERARRQFAQAAATVAATEAADGAWHWVIYETLAGERDWVPAQRERNHWNSTNFSGIPLYEVSVGPAITLAAPVQAVAPTDARDCLQDVVSHYQDIMAALKGMGASVQSPDNRAYWHHQIAAWKRIGAQAERALAAQPAAQPADAQDHARDPAPAHYPDPKYATALTPEQANALVRPIAEKVMLGGQILPQDMLDLVGNTEQAVLAGLRANAIDAARTQGGAA